MITWYKIELSVKQPARGRMGEIQQNFDTVHMSIGSPRGIVLFSSLHRGTVSSTPYFLPDSAELLKSVINTYGGEECQRPNKDELDSEQNSICQFRLNSQNAPTQVALSHKCRL